MSKALVLFKNKTSALDITPLVVQIENSLMSAVMSPYPLPYLPQAQILIFQKIYPTHNVCSYEPLSPYLPSRTETDIQKDIQPLIMSVINRSPYPHTFPQEQRLIFQRISNP